MHTQIQLKNINLLILLKCKIVVILDNTKLILAVTVLVDYIKDKLIKLLTD